MEDDTRLDRLERRVAKLERELETIRKAIIRRFARAEGTGSSPETSDDIAPEASAGTVDRGVPGEPAPAPAPADDADSPARAAPADSSPGGARAEAPREDAPADSSRAAADNGPPTGRAAGRSGATPRARGGGELEAWIGRNGLLVIGVLALVAAVAFLIQHALASGWISPLVQVAAGLAGGLGLGLYGERTARRGARTFGAALVGGGGAVAYLSVWAAAGPYRLVPASAGTPALLAVAALVFWRATRHDREYLAALAAAGAFLAPLVLPPAVTGAAALLAYYGAVAGGSGAVAAVRGWRPTAWIALLGALAAPALLPVPLVRPRLLLAYGAFLSVGAGAAALRQGWRGLLGAALLVFAGAGGVEWPTAVAAWILVYAAGGAWLARRAASRSGPSRQAASRRSASPRDAPSRHASPGAARRGGGPAWLEVGTHLGAWFVLLSAADLFSGAYAWAAHGAAALLVAPLFRATLEGREASRATGAGEETHDGETHVKGTSESGTVGSGTVGSGSVGSGAVASAGAPAARTEGSDRRLARVWLSGYGLAATTLFWAIFAGVVRPPLLEDLPMVLYGALAAPYVFAGLSGCSVVTHVLGLALLAAGVPAQWDGMAVPAAWTALALAATATTLRRPMATARWAAFGLLQLASAHLFTVGLVLRRDFGPAFTGTWSLALYGVLAASVVSASLLAGRPEPPDPALGTRTLRRALWALAGGLVFLGGTSEIVYAWDRMGPAADLLARDLTISAFWLLYAGGLLAAGFRRGVRGVRLAGLGILVVAVLKVVLYDLTELDTLYRVGSLGLLAAVALVAARAYYGRSEDPGRG